ncbi:MAG: hypothetical protein ACXABE_12450 [Candidatus Thorarchaeota archaeon]
MNGDEPITSGHKLDSSIKKLMVVSIVIVIFGVAFLVVQTQLGLPILDPLPSSDNIPSEDPFWENIGNLSISARIDCSVQDTHRWDSFEVDLILRVNNTGPTSVMGFHPVKLSIFRDDHWHYFTFGLVPSTNTTIEAFSNISLSYEGDRTLNSIEVITPRQGSIAAYGRVLISYWGHETIVTTSLFRDIFPIE